jgi:tRNA G10  N-methylase Trm11
MSSKLAADKIDISIETWLEITSEQDSRLLAYFRDKFMVYPELNRKLVSFQANKNRPEFRWFKFKEAFSASLVELLLQKYSIKSGKILDPFAGSGTALFAASRLGLEADGIEILPIGQQIINAKLCLESDFSREDFRTLNPPYLNCVSQKEHIHRRP